jgi:hypothetical protein
MADTAGSRRPPGATGPAFRDASAEGPPAAPSWRSFAVEAYVGRKTAGWPLGRFGVRAEGLRVRVGFPWFITRSTGKDTITVVSVARTWAGIWCVRFEDSGQRLADVHVLLPVRAQRIIDELRRCGYAIADRKTGEPGRPLAEAPPCGLKAAASGPHAEAAGQPSNGGCRTSEDRRAAEYDWELLRSAAELNGATEIALTIADYLDMKNTDARRYDQLQPETILLIERPSERRARRCVVVPEARTAASSLLRVSRSWASIPTGRRGTRGVRACRGWPNIPSAG